jgi:prepilin-type N-terminal cleavage/methylation domain-containing protein
MRTATARHNCKKTLQPAFTLMEMMVVLVMAGIMIALAIPRIDSTRYKADAIAQIVRTTLQSASRTAITNQHDMIVSFDTLGQKIRTVWDMNNDGLISTGERVTWRGLDTGILFADPSVNGISGGVVHSPVNGIGVTYLAGLPTVTFHRDGSVSTDAEIYVSIAARGPPTYRAILLTQATGRVDWYRLNTTTGKWILSGL